MSKPERDLWSAVLEQAILDLSYPNPNLKRRGRKKKEREAYRSSLVSALRERNAARVWFRSGLVRINSFRGICLNLGLDSQHVLGKYSDKIFVKEILHPTQNRVTTKRMTHAHG